MPNDFDTGDVRKAIDFFRRGGALSALACKDVRHQLNVLHRHTSELIEQNEFAAAERICRILTLYAPWTFEYWYIFGQCCQAQASWKDAIYAYGRAAELRMDDPQVVWAAAECFIQTGDRMRAIKALKAVQTICRVTQAEPELYCRAETMLDKFSDTSASD